MQHVSYKLIQSWATQHLGRSKHISMNSFQVLFVLALCWIHTGSSLSTSRGLDSTTWMSSISKSCRACRAVRERETGSTCVLEGRCFRLCKRISLDVVGYCVRMKDLSTIQLLQKPFKCTEIQFDTKVWQSLAVTGGFIVGITRQTVWTVGWVCFLSTQRPELQTWSHSRTHTYTHRRTVQTHEHADTSAVICSDMWNTYSNRPHLETHKTDWKKSEKQETSF